MFQGENLLKGCTIEKCACLLRLIKSPKHSSYNLCKTGAHVFNLIRGKEMAWFSSVRLKRVHFQCNEIKWTLIHLHKFQHDFIFSIESPHIY